MKKLLSVALCISALAFSALSMPVVAVSIPPQKFLVEEIGGGAWSCLVVIEKGQDPHLFEPTPRQLVALRQCEVYFKIGLPFETILVDKLLKTNPGVRVAGVTNAVGHAHESEGHEEGVGSHAEDPHIWLAPDQMVELSATMAEEFSRLDPDHAEQYAARQAKFVEKTQALRQELTQRLTQAGVKIVLVYHPAWGHFAEAFGLEQVAVEAHGRTPGARHLEAVSDAVRKHGVKVMLVQSETERRRITAFATKLGLRTVVVYPLADNIFETMRATVEALCGDAAVQEPLSK